VSDVVDKNCISAKVHALHLHADDRTHTKSNIGSDRRQEARELHAVHEELSAMKEVRDQALEKLKRERQLQATKVIPRTARQTDKEDGRNAMCASI
jgi:hypothetical protein